MKRVKYSKYVPDPASEMSMEERVEMLKLNIRRLTHDLLHYAVEREAHLAVGFWGTLAAGTRTPDQRPLALGSPASRLAWCRAPCRGHCATAPLTDRQAQMLMV